MMGKHSEHKQKVATTFNTVCDAYDCEELRFFHSSAQRMLDLLSLTPDERLIDVAAGTGHITLAAAQRLNAGAVHSVDLSEGMLQQASEKARALGLSNIEFHCSDLEHLEKPDQVFDAASCGFGIFFLPDMESGLRAIHGQLRPGGRFIMSTFMEGMQEPLTDLFLDRIQAYGLEPPPLSWKRVDTADKASALLGMTGFKSIDTHEEQLGYYLPDAQAWWSVLWNSGYRGLLMQLEEDALERFRAEHLEEVSGHAGEQGIWMDIRVLFTQGVA
jgi:ubiquinone/menaquinone biosynthesis C-methylase UbiE